MRRWFWLAFLPAGLAGQQPAVSPVLPRVWQRSQDTTVTVWLFAHRQASLANIAEQVAAAGGRVRVRSRWLHAVSADVPASGLRVLAQNRLLRRIQPLGRFRRRSGSPDIERLSAITPLALAGPGDTCGVTPGDDPV